MLTGLQDHSQFEGLAGCPVNMLYTEVLLSHRDRQLQGDTTFRKLLFSVLANYAAHVENLHKYRPSTNIF